MVPLYTHTHTHTLSKTYCIFKLVTFFFVSLMGYYCHLSISVNIYPNHYFNGCIVCHRMIYCIWLIPGSETFVKLLFVFVASSSWYDIRLLSSQGCWDYQGENFQEVLSDIWGLYSVGITILIIRSQAGLLGNVLVSFGIITQIP